MAFRFLGLILLPWTLQPGGGQRLTQLGEPIQVTLARHHLPLTCEVTYPYTPAFTKYTFSYYHIDLQGRQSPPVWASCSQTPGVKNMTHTEMCSFTLTALHNASATGTYYCLVKWPSHKEAGRGTFILVRDAGYKEPPESSKKILLFTFTGLLAVLSILGTGLLLWKAKKQRKSAKKIPHQKDSGPAGRSADPTPVRAGSIYTALQPHQAEVYDCLQNESSVPPSEWSPPTQTQKQMGVEELNTIYENF
ncbi:NFAT activation molecule 1 [Phascolarctos cinereus]|uniref:NFAT activation molecule 1 isoform X2 n=1 Tax=Phascolarctos cinereus TaxID=38626 RepID=A0A6P5K021_PHACI|nr:NFAT activation molecule 1 isoform X2 [Phascolarctos cinereus]